MPLPSAGFHYGVPFAEYQQWDAANISTLKPLADSPLHCRYAKDNPTESDEMDVGSALHVKIFEPARFDKEFYCGTEEYNGTTKEGKAIKEAELAEAAGRIYLRKKKGEAVDCDSVLGMSESLWAHPAAKTYLEMPGQCEVSAVWKDSITGLMCKARFDKLIGKESRLKRLAVCELKSCRKGFAKTPAFGREIAKRYYHAQAAYYLWAVKEITGEDALHVFFPVENVPPYAANWGTLGDQDLQTGAIVFRNWLNEYTECVKVNRWPGYPPNPTPIFSMPNWANRMEYEHHE